MPAWLIPTRASQSDQLSLPSRRPPDPSTPTTMTPQNTNYNRPLDPDAHLSRVGSGLRSQRLRHCGGAIWSVAST
jgi:hypothetical protein